MMERTLAIIKPDAVAAKNSGKIIDMIEAAGFSIDAMAKAHLDKDMAEHFYEMHEDKPFFNELVDFMSSGPCIIMMLSKDNAIADWRKLMGATNPAQADAGTIRKLYAKSIGENAVHGSDSPESAERELGIFFEGFEEGCCE